MSRNTIELMGIPSELFYWLPGEMVVIIKLPCHPTSEALDLLEGQVRALLNPMLARYNLGLERYGTAGRAGVKYPRCRR